ncbi:MAG: flagellar protein FlgN, partial [Tepidanaerobacteraceae bacterium]
SDGQLKAINDSVLSLVTRIKAVDDANLEGVKNLFAKLKEDIAAFRQTETALKGYGLLGTSNRDGAFIDTKK